MKKIFKLFLFTVFFCQPMYVGYAQQAACENEFIITKTKNKKESAGAVKEDIGTLLESCHQQVSKNMIELAKIQQQIFDKIKDLVGACDVSSTEKSVFDGSIVQLKEQRCKLQAFHQELLQQQQKFQSFPSCFSK